MTKKRIVSEFGMGSSLRKMDYTGACIRALKDALWHNSLNVAQAFGVEKSAMIVDIEIACQKPDQVDLEAVKAVLPYGKGSASAVKGGLDIPQPYRDGHTVIAHAAVKVSFDMEPAS